MSFSGFEYCTSVSGSSGIEENKKTLSGTFVQEQKKFVKAQHITLQK